MSDSQDAIQPPSPLQDALVDAVRRLLGRGSSELDRIAKSSRTRLELRQMQKDLDHFWVRLGKTAYHLSKGDEISHPGLDKAIARIDELEARIDDLRTKGTPE
jgi:hypothetical protein